MRGWGLCICCCLAPWALGGALWAGFNHHDYWAAALGAFVIVTILEAANTGDTRGKAQD